MKITKEHIKALRPCESGWIWYCENARHIEDLKELLLFINDNSPANARWLFTNLMSRDQKVEIALYAAEQVLPIYEKYYPEDKRVRECIQAVKDYEAGEISLEELRERRGAYAAAYAAAYATAAAAYATAAAAYAAAYATAAAAAADAAAAYAADAAAAATDAAARKEMQERIILKAVEILEAGE